MSGKVVIDVARLNESGAVRNLGKPVALARKYYDQGADEITFLNITGFRDFPLTDTPMLSLIRYGFAAHQPDGPTDAHTARHPRPACPRDRRGGGARQPGGRDEEVGGEASFGTDDDGKGDAAF